jgi:zinc D-Ala-D-Ala carboxypeptidase
MRRIALAAALILPAVLLSGCLLYPVSKETALPENFVPDNLVVIPAEWTAPGFEPQRVHGGVIDDLGALIAEGRAQGFDIRVRSAYRSFETRQFVFQDCVERLGREQAERFCAEPGHSEHQLGTAVDVSSPAVNWRLTQEFADTPDFQWLEANAHRFGFALSYPQDAEAITGFAFEPWHFRYIGRAPAAEWHASGLTLLEYLEQR